MESQEQTAPPPPIPAPDWDPLTKYVRESVERVADGKGEPKDFEHWIFEHAMEAVYGKEIWKWWNARV